MTKPLCGCAGPASPVWMPPVPTPEPEPETLDGLPIFEGYVPPDQELEQG